MTLDALLAFGNCNDGVEIVLPDIEPLALKLVKFTLVGKPVVSCPVVSTKSGCITVGSCNGKVSLYGAVCDEEINNVVLIFEDDESNISNAGLPVDVMKTAVLPFNVFVTFKLFNNTVSGKPVESSPLLLRNKGAFADGRVVGNVIVYEVV